MEREELASWLRLLLTPGVGNDTARKLMAAFGPPATLFSTPAAAWRELVGPTLAAALAQPPPDLAAQLAATNAWLEQAEPGMPRHVLHLADPDYPQALLNTEDPPLMLFVLGDIRIPWPAAIAVVGSRNPTPQGQINARQFGHSLAQAGLTVVSGLALGIDGAAHEGLRPSRWSAPGSTASIRASMNHSPGGLPGGA
jgi:DNA processing protein